MKYLEYALGIVGIILCGGLFIFAMSFLALVWSVMWVIGFPVRVTDEGGKTLGHYRWFTFHRSRECQQPKD